MDPKWLMGGEQEHCSRCLTQGGELGSDGIRIEIRRSSTTHRDIASCLRGFGVLVEDFLLKGEEVVEIFEGCVDDHCMGEGWGKMGGLDAGKCCEKNFSNGERMVSCRKAKNLFRTVLEAFEKKK
jgi:hypothetical protein